MTAGNEPAPVGAGTPAPRPVAEVDEGLVPLVREFHRIRWIWVALALLVLFVAVIVLAVISNLNREQLSAARTQITLQQQQLAVTRSELSASCQWWRGLAPLPVTIPAGQKSATRLSVSLIAGAREAFQGQRCGPLPAADPSLLRWAAIYKIPVP